MAIEVSLREVAEQDLSDFFVHQLEPAHVARLGESLSTANVKVRTISADDKIVGYVAHFWRNDQPEVSYWIGSEHWNKGFATRALRRFLAEVEVRPLYARAAKNNIGSVRVLEKCGFSVVGEGQFVAEGHEVGEFIFALGESQSGRADSG
jgi:RimJ/RimL family protein N-acetyltransferase